jgi:phage major head subunit gpT-like protein
MPMNTGAFSQLLAPGFRKVFFQAFKEREPQYSMLFKVIPSSRAYEEELEVAGLGTMPTKDEGAAVVYQDGTQGGKKRYTHFTYALGFRITEEMWEDDLYAVMNRFPKELGKGGRNAREVVSFNVLNLGFSTQFGFQKFGANETLFSTAHSLIIGGAAAAVTQANRSATDMDLGVSSLEAAILLFDNLVDETNIPCVFIPELLVVPPNLKQVAVELLGSEFKPYTAGNEVNAFIRNNPMRFIVVNYLTNSNSWFLFADDHDFKFFERRPLRFQNGDDFDTGDAKFKGSQRFSVGASEYRGSFGSLGG